MTDRRAATRTRAADGRESGSVALAFAGVLFALAISSVLTASSAFTSGWIIPAAGMAAVMVLVGLAVRQLTRSSFNGRVTAWWLQALVAIAMLLGLEAAKSGFSTGPWETAKSFGESFAYGIGNIAWYHSVPIVVGETVLPAILSAVALIVLLNDLVMRVVRVPALAAVWLFLPLLLPMQLPVEISILPVIAVAVLFALALLLSSKTGVRMRRHGLVAVAAVTAAVVALPLLVPNPRDAGIAAPDWLTQEGQGVFPPAVPLLSTDIDLAANLKRPQAVDVLQYTSDTGMGTYLQLTTLGDASQGGFTAFPEGSSDARLPEGDDIENGIAWFTQTTVTMTSLGMRSDSLPIAPGQPKDVTTSLDYAFDPVTEAYSLSTSRDRIPEGTEWTSSGMARLGLAGQVTISGFPATAPEPGLPLTDLPDELSGLRDMAAEIVTDSDGTDLDMVMALIEFFTDNTWQYSEEIPFAGFGDDADGQWSALLEFLEARVGYCVHYATAFAALARALDIPSRVSVGFLPGMMSDGIYTVTTNDMHAWTEVYIQGIGWMIVDVTPPVAAGQLQASDLGDNPFGPNGTEPTPFDPSESSTTPSDSPSASASDPSDSPSDSAEPSLAPDQPGDESSALPTATDDAGELYEPTRMHPGWIVTLLLLLVLLLPMAARGGQRLAHMRGGAAGAWREIVATGVDAGVDVPQHATPRLVVQAMQPRLSDDGLEALQRMRSAAESAAFGPPDAPVDPVSDEAKADAELVSRELWRRVRGPEALLRRMLPMSLLPEPLRSKQT
ncbi:transglutaminaseTgpA domain-containing protein [Agrococcus casei]|uniref:transglutaminaseTgpA domain-containing protein n=1 Tax=Agrococcus casei TaxID=343512 RepID=UPI003F914FEA